MKHLASAAAVLCLLACSRAEIPGQCPGLVFSTDGSASTKAACAVTPAQTLLFSEFLAPDGVSLGNIRPSAAHGWTCARREDGLYVPKQEVPPVDFNVFSKAQFYLYGPAGLDWVSLSGNDRTGPPLLYCSLPADPSLQEDLYAGKSPEYSASDFFDSLSGRYSCLERADVQLHHILTCVSVKTDGDGIASAKVKSVSFRGVYSKGTYSFGDGSWSGIDGAGTVFSASPGVQLDGTPYQSVLSPESGTAFMMIPQTLPSGAVVELVLETEDGERSCSCTIAGNLWRAGYHASYLLHADKPSGDLDINPFIPGGDQDEIL